VRILFTTHQGELAGATLSITYLAQGLAKNGHEIHVACEQGCLLWKNLNKVDGVFPHDIRFQSYLDFKAAKALSLIVREFQIDLINAQGGKDRNLVILAKWICRLSAKIVFTRRQRPRDEPWIKRWFHLNGTDGIVMVSHGLKKIFVKKGYPEYRLKVIHNGVDPGLIPQLGDKERKKIRVEYGLQGRVVGCLSRKKIQEDIIRALKYLPEDITFLFVGIERLDLQHVIDKENPHQQLVFTGEVAHQEALQYLQLMDVNILASHMEGFGLVLVEAMLSKVAVVASDFGGIPDIIDDQINGLLYENSQPQHLADCVNKLLTNDEFRLKLIKNGHEKALRNFTIDRVIKDYEKYFTELVCQN